MLTDMSQNGKHSSVTDNSLAPGIAKDAPLSAELTGISCCKAVVL